MSVAVGEQSPGDPSVVVWSQTLHDESGRYRAAQLRVRSDAAIVLQVGDMASVLDDADARSLFATLGRVLAG